jgi:hypothetical protein
MVLLLVLLLVLVLVTVVEEEMHLCIQCSFECLCARSDKMMSESRAWGRGGRGGAHAALVG